MKGDELIFMVLVKNICLPTRAPGQPLVTGVTLKLRPFSPRGSRCAVAVMLPEEDGG